MLSRVFYALIIGAKGTTKKRVESETKTIIKVPKPGAEGNIEVLGATRQSVCSARRRIELIVIGARHKQESTHFLCIPIVHSTIKERFTAFKVGCFIEPITFISNVYVFRQK